MQERDERKEEIPDKNLIRSTSTDRAKNVLFLASGRGSNLQSFIDHVSLGVLQNTRIRAVICNHPDTHAAERAKAVGIPVFEIEGVSARKFNSKEKRDQARLAFDNECISISKTFDIDYVVLAGFDQILTKSFVDNFPYRILNIHPAYDLKMFGGKNMVGSKVHEAVLSSGMRYSGCSIHFVIASVDQGAVIMKKRVEILSGDTPSSLEARILEQEHLAFPESLQLVVDGRVIISESGTQCFVDRYSNDWDIEWSKRQEAYATFIQS